MEYPNLHININHLNSLNSCNIDLLFLPYMPESLPVFSVSSCCIFFYTSPLWNALYIHIFRGQGLLFLWQQIQCIMQECLNEKRKTQGLKSFPVFKSYVILNGKRGSTSKWTPFSKNSSCPYFSSTPLHNAIWWSLFMWGNGTQYKWVACVAILSARWLKVYFTSLKHSISQ